MQPVCFFVGKVNAEPKVIQNAGKQPFIAFTLESSTPGRQYPDRLSVATFKDKCPDIVQGDIVSVVGNAKADAYKNAAGEAKATLKVWANSVEVFGGGTVAPTIAQQMAASVARGRTSIPDPKSPAAVDPDDVPF